MTEKKFDFSRKASRGRLIQVLNPLIGITLGLLVGALFIASQGVNPLTAYYYLLEGSVLSWYTLSSSLVKTIPLAFTGLAVCYSYRAGIFNIGAEGQVYLGAIGATIVGLYVDLPMLLHIPLAIIAGGILGGLLAFLPGYLKAYKGINEIVVTMLINYIALYFLSMVVQGPLKEPNSFFPRSLPLAESTRFAMIPGSNLHTGVFIVLGLAIFLYWFFNRTTYGFKMEAAGYNPRALHYAGVDVRRLLTNVMITSGFIAGAAGAVEIMGVHGRLIENFSVGLGYDAIAVALLANLNPLGAMLSAFFFGALKTGANSMQIATGIPVSFVYMVQAMVILFVIGSTAFPRILKKLARNRRVRQNG